MDSLTPKPTKPFLVFSSIHVQHDQIYQTLINSILHWNNQVNRRKYIISINVKFTSLITCNHRRRRIYRNYPHVSHYSIQTSDKHSIYHPACLPRLLRYHNLWDIIYSPFPEKNRPRRVIRTGIAVRCLVFTSIKDFSIYYSQTPIMTPVLCLFPLHSIKDTHSIPHLSLFIITIFNTLCYLSGLPRNRKSVLQNREIPCIPIPALE